MEAQGMLGSQGSLNCPLREAESEDHYEMIQNRSMRVHTVKIDLTAIDRTPCVAQLHDFVARSLLVHENDLVRMQWNHRERCLYLKMFNQATAEALVGTHSGRHRFPSGSSRPRIALTLEDGTVDVVLHDLSELIHPEDVYNVMGQYGLVQNITQGRWGPDQHFAGVPNGQLIVSMVVRRPIPRVLQIGGEETAVTYDGQPTPSTSLLAGLLHTVRRWFRRA